MKRGIIGVASLVAFCVLSAASAQQSPPPFISVESMIPLTTVPVSSGMVAQAGVAFTVPAIGVSPSDLFWTGLGTLSNSTIVPWTPDNVGASAVRRSMKLNGTIQSFGIRTGMTMPTEDFTIDFWVKGTAQGVSNSNGLNDDGGGLFSYAVSGTPNELLILGHGSATDGRISVWIKGVEVIHPPTLTNGFLTPTLFDNQWHHLLLRRRVDVYEYPLYPIWSLELFVDGVACSNNIPHDDHLNITSAFAAPISPNGTLVLGQDQDAFSSSVTGEHEFEGNQNWGGYIDDVRIWSNLQSPDIRGRLFPTGTAHLVHQWRFDEFQNLGYAGGGSDDVKDFVASNARHMDTAEASLSTNVPLCSDRWLVSSMVGPGTGGIGLSILANGNITGTNGALFSVPSPVHNLFVYAGSGSPPTAFLATPSGGPTNGGTLVTLTGERMSLLTYMTIDGSPIPFSVIDDEHVSFVTPPRPVGTADILLGSPVGSSHFYGFAYGPRTLLVPSQYASISAAVNHSYSGDTIEISPRTANYHEHGIDLGTRSLVIRGNGPREKVIIDGDHAGVIFKAQPDPGFGGVTFENLTIIDGDAATDAGVGGSITGTIVGGPADQTPIIIRNCRFTSSQGIRGAAVSLTGGRSVIENCVFEDCTFSAPGSGGVVYLELTVNSVISECVFTTNGGWNSGNQYGAIYAAQNSNLRIRSSTIVENLGVICGGIGLAQNISPLVTHCILWGNVHPVQPGHGTTPVPDQIISNGDVSLAVRYCDVSGAVPGTASNNINADPRFRDRLVRDYHLTTVSPCVDAGAASTQNLAVLDMDGEPRRVQLSAYRVDIGADEYLRGPYRGSEEDLWLDALVNGLSASGTPAQMQMVDVQEGDQLVLHFGSRHGIFVGSIPLIVGQPFALASPPTSLTEIVHIDPNFDPPPFVIYWGESVPTPFGTIALPLTTEGLTFVTTIPLWMPGNAILVQGFAVTGTADNGFFASTDGIRLQHP